MTITKNTPKTLRDKIHKQQAKDWETIIKKEHDISEESKDGELPSS